MKTRPRSRTKAEDVPAPTRAQFENFVRGIVTVPKVELERRERNYQRKKKHSKV